MGCDEVDVRQHQHKEGDKYCRYEVVAKTGNGGIAIGSEVCIFCEKPEFIVSCDKSFIMKTAKGVTYTLKKISHSCEECREEIIKNKLTFEYAKQ